MFTEIEDFFSNYTMDTSVQSTEFDPVEQEGQFETYGEDIKHVLRVAEQHPRRVWTLLDGEENVILVNGFHYVNRICYFITNEDGTEGETYEQY